MTASSRVLVVDVGTSSVRAAILGPDGTLGAGYERELLPDSPAEGLVEFDAALLAHTCLELARAALDAEGAVDAVGISDQRGSTVVWDRATGEPVGPGLGWQDLRTVIECLTLAGQGIRMAPNAVATKAAHLLNEADPDRTRDLCVGTVDSWVAWTLSLGSIHVTDVTNAALYGLRTDDQTDWDDHALEVLNIPRSTLPTVVDSIGVVGEAR